MPTTPPELKFTALDLKAVEPDGTFAGYASLFHTEDMGHDIVLPGAFRDSLAQRGVRGIKMLFQHKPDEPIGVWETLKEDARGLFARGRLMLDVARARETLSLMRAGALDGLSIGFRAVTGRRDAKTGIRRLAKIDLWEISVVTFPLLPEARVAQVKARPFANHTPTEREFERWLTQDAGLASVTELALLGGANLAAVRNSDGQWEVLQFQSAVLTAPATYILTGFLRGQAGTEHAMRGPLPAGARFVLLDGALARVDMTQDEIGLAYNWKCGPASRDIGSPNYVQLAHTFTGEGLKPLSPVHIRATRFSGDLNITWLRRTRTGGDSWDGIDVPLGETEERYEIDILDGATVKRTLTAPTPAATYTATQQTADFGTPQSSISLRIVQLSATRGRGTPREAVL